MTPGKWIIPRYWNISTRTAHSFSAARSFSERGFLALFLLHVAAFPVALGDALRAGAARIDITPPAPVLMDGYGSRTNLSQGVHDPLSARALAFAQDGRKLVLASLDVLGFYNNTADPLRGAILETCHLQPSELLLCAIHTHSAPTLTLNAERGHSNNVAYTRMLQGKLVEVVQSALSHLEPIEVKVGSGSSPVGVNRREVVMDNAGVSKTVLGRNPSVLTDREVQVLEVSQANRTNPVAVLFAYATHSTSLGPRNYQISGDIHGLAAQFLEDYFNTVAPEFAGASGNIDPWVRVLPEFKSGHGWVPEPVLMATLLGEEVARVLDNTQPVQTNGPMKSQLKIVQLPSKLPRDPQSNPDHASVPFTITVARIGEIAFVGLGGEVFNELGKTIKLGSPFAHTFVFTHCNGAAGYVPTRASYPQGGYEVESSSFGPGAGEQLADDAIQMLKELR